MAQEVFRKGMEAALGLEVARLCQHGTAFWASKGQEWNDSLFAERKGIEQAK